MCLGLMIKQTQDLTLSLIIGKHKKNISRKKEVEEELGVKHDIEVT